MQVAENTVVTFEYTVADERGKLIESSRDGEPMCYLHGAGRIVPGLEMDMEGRSAGDTFSVTLAPNQAYGERDESDFHVFTREEMVGLGEFRLGMQLQAQDASEGMRILTVSRVEDDKITLDGNHPLAGQTVGFDVTILDVRNATEEEMGHGQYVRCTDDCATCELDTSMGHDHDCGCGDECGHHHG